MTMHIPDDFEAILRNLTDAELLEYLAQSENPEYFQAEVQRRLRRRAEQELRAQQHAEISRMVEHLDQTKVDWQTVREFFRDTLLEFTSRSEDQDPGSP